MSTYPDRNPFQSVSSPLKERDMNIESPQKSKSVNTAVNDPPMKPENHHLNLLGRKRGSGQTRSYVSPSDAIQSPATQKLAMFKHKQIAKTPARGPLFATSKTSSVATEMTDSTSVGESAQADEQTSVTSAERAQGLVAGQGDEDVKTS